MKNIKPIPKKIKKTHTILEKVIFLSIFLLSYIFKIIVILIDNHNIFKNKLKLVPY
ncbi:unnamed protein product [marine sediment metagenome]|uniref:Uncharacterized protein n=1 Tax=marine sediment metagenome TaxID=412755 RepID=X1DCI8_9ZZZZ